MPVSRDINLMKNDLNYNVKVVFENSEALVYATKLHNEKLDYWQGWECAAGVNGIYIYEDKVFGGECCNDQLGTTDCWNLIENYTICKRERCSGCTTDLMQAKQRR